ncbi:peptidase S8/S53 domain-containing protein [Trichoderma evansii]
MSSRVPSCPTSIQQSDTHDSYLLQNDLVSIASFLLAVPFDDLFYEAGGNVISGLFNTFLDALDKSYCTYSAYGETGDLEGVDPTYPDTSPGGYDQPEQRGAYTPTNVISISYDEDGTSLPMNYQRRQCNEWMKLGLQGLTVVVASGDGGVGAFAASCPGGAFGAVSPADCPFVTAVGATNVTAFSIDGKKTVEQAARFSGGGFSNILGTPSYQAETVDSYFHKHPPPYDYYNITINATHTTGLYNRGGRGYPDVSAAGVDFKPIGFINPVLYQHPEVFNDIIGGSNPGCNTTGFSAVEGWDPVTGLGTPNYEKLKEVLLRLP